MSDQVKVTLTADAQMLIAAFKQAGISVDQFDTKATKASSGFRAAWGQMKGLAGELGLAMGLGEITRQLAGFTVSSYDAALAQKDVKSALTDLLGSSAAYEDAIRQVQAATKNTISETEAARTAFGLLDNGIAQSAEEAAQYALAGKALNSALGETASYEKFLMLLDEGSAMLLNNFNITQSAVEARQREIMATDGVGEAEARLTAIRQLALEKGLALADTMSEETIQRQQAAASYEDFQASFGGLVSSIEQSFGVMDKSISLLNKMSEGAEAWGGVLDNVATISNINQRAAKNLGFEYSTLNSQLMRQVITLEDWEQAQQTAAAQLQRETEMMVRAEAQAKAMDAALRGAADASLQLAEAELASAGASQQALDAWGARYQGLDNITRTQGQAGVDLLNTMTGNVTPAAGIAEAISTGLDDIDLGGSFKSVADSLASQLSGAVSSAFGRMQEVAPEGSIIAGMFEAEDPGEFGRRLMALAEQGMEGMDSAWADAFTNAAGGNPIYAGLLQSIEEGDSAAVAAEANRLLSANLADVIATGLIENLRTSFEEQQLMEQVQAIVMEQIAGTGMEGDAAGLLGMMMGDPGAVAGNITDSLTPAVEGLKQSLGGLGSAGEAAAGEEGAGSSLLSPLVTDATSLDVLFNTTLPGSLEIALEMLQAMVEDGVEQLAIITTAVTELDTAINQTTDPGLTTMQATGVTTAQNIDQGMKKAVKTIGTNLVEAIKDATEAFWKMADAAAAAAGASNSAGASAPKGHTWGGGRASGGPISAGDLYLVGERGPELFIPGSSGYIAPFRESDPATISAGSTGGGSLTIGTLVLNGVQDVQTMFDGIEREARARGYQFQMVS